MTDPHAPDPQNEPQAAQAAPGTAIAAQGEDRTAQAAADVGGVGDLPAEARTRLALQKARNREVLAIAAEERSFAAAASKIAWARDLSPEALMKLAGWAKEPSRDLDLLTEFNLLGGTSGYVNAKWYIRQLGYLVAEGVVEYAYYDTVTADDRLDRDAREAEDEAVKLEGKLAQAVENTGGGMPVSERDRLVEDLLDERTRAREKRREVRRRADERLKYDLPDGAKSAVVWHVKLYLMAQEVVAAQAVGGYRGKGSSGKDKDPVGEEFPRETAITRGARKVMLALGHVAPRLKAKIEAAEAAALEAAGNIPQLSEEGRAELRSMYATPRLRPADGDYGSAEIGSVSPRGSRD